MAGCAPLARPTLLREISGQLKGDVMREIGVFEAKNKLGQLLDRVERGEEIVITRHGRPIARMVRAGPGFDREAARRVVTSLHKASRGVKLRGLKIKNLIGAGPLRQARP
jgi:prevent-host-death family protein